MFACIKYRNLREHDEVKKKSKRNNNNKPAKYTQYNKIIIITMAFII